jgi:hypothetical protein
MGRMVGPMEAPMEDPKEDPMEDPKEDPKEDRMEDPKVDRMEDPMEDPMEPVNLKIQCQKRHIEAKLVYFRSSVCTRRYLQLDKTNRT